MGKMFLLVIDSYTKWLDVHVTYVSSSAATIYLLRKLFSTFGLPEVLVSDNGALILQVRSLPGSCVPTASNTLEFVSYHPSSNGLVECAVQTLKSGLKKLREGIIETMLWI